MSRWTCTYQGCPDPLSKVGHAAPSWHTFDRRVWERGSQCLTLTGSRSRAYGKSNEYRVVVLNGRGECILERTGHDWQRLVREAKQDAPEPLEE